MTLPRNFVILANKIWCGFKIICSIRNYWPENRRKKGNWQTEIVRNRLKVNKIVSTVVMVGIAKLFRQACRFVRLSGSITRPPCQCACLSISALFSAWVQITSETLYFSFLKFMWQSTWNTLVFVAPRWASKHFFYKFKFELPWCSLLNSASSQFTLGSLSNYDDDHNDSFKQTICLTIKTTALHVHHAFSTFLWRPLHDYDMKPPNLTFYGGRGHTTTNFPSSFWTWIKSLRIQLQEKSPAFDLLSGSKQTRISLTSLKERKFIFLPTFSLSSSSSSSSSSSLKVPTEPDPTEKGLQCKG